MYKFKPLLALLLFLPLIIHAQTRTITGTVTDDRGIPVPNVTIQMKGGRTTQTDLKGHFSIPVTGTGTVSLTLSSVGLKPLTITADDKKEMTIQLALRAKRRTQNA